MTLLVLKFEGFDFTNDEQSLNIFFILIALLVLNLDKLNSLND